MKINTTVIGVDMGGTQMRAGKFIGQDLITVQTELVHSAEDETVVFEQLCTLISKVFDSTVEGIGIGVPGLVHTATGTVFDVVNIPSWKRLELGEKLRQRFRVNVIVNNDANAFALGEWFYGAGKDASSMIALSIGTGLGSGVILNNRLYEGNNGGAGEFGMIPYLDHNIEYYASGQFFRDVHGLDGGTLALHAKEGDENALEIFAEFGTHLGFAIQIIMYSFDVSLIVLGGSVSQSFDLFKESMWRKIRQFGFQNALNNLRIMPSTIEHSAIKGAAVPFLADVYKNPDQVSTSKSVS